MLIVVNSITSKSQENVSSVAEKHEGQPKGLKLINSAPEINEAATIKQSVNSATIKEMHSAPRGHL